MSDTYRWGKMYFCHSCSKCCNYQPATATFTDLILKDKLLGEAYFLRAYFYQQLLRFYGGIPLIDKAL
jgi:hypothetical protein